MIFLKKVSSVGVSRCARRGLIYAPAHADATDRRNN